jgi:hypothetical protein
MEYRAGVDKLTADNYEQRAQVGKWALLLSVKISPVSSVCIADVKAFDAYLSPVAWRVDRASGLLLLKDDCRNCVQLQLLPHLAAAQQSLLVCFVADRLLRVLCLLQLDKVAADAAEFKAGYDKLTADNWEQKAQVRRERTAHDCCGCLVQCCFCSAECACRSLVA